MNITIAKYTKSASILAVIDGQEMIIPDDNENRHRVMLAEWEAGGGVIDAYAEPVLTPDELRAQMPTLSSRQFWLAANTLGITEDMLLAATDDAEIIIEIRKTTEFHRTYGSVVMLAPLMGITSEQLDGVWLWAAAV